MNGVNFEEAAVFRQAKSGDKDAFGKLIINYEKAMYNTAYRFMGSREDARDMSQEAALKLFRGIGRCAGPDHFKKLVYVVVSNTCIDELRKRKDKAAYSIDAKLDLEDGVLEIQAESGERGPEERLISKEILSGLQAAINRLSPDHKAVVVLRDVRGLSYEEVAEAVACSVGTVKSRLARARGRLKDIILKEGYCG